MALKECKGKALSGKPFGNELRVMRGVYDFAKDGGATTDTYAVLEAQDDIVIHGFYAKAKAAVTSGSSATLAVGVNGGNTSILLAATGKASFSLSALVQPTSLVLSEGTPNTYVAAMPLKLASGGKIIQTVGAAALTAGIVEYVFLVSAF